MKCYEYALYNYKLVTPYKTKTVLGIHRHNKKVAKAACRKIEGQHCILVRDSKICF